MSRELQDQLAKTYPQIFGHPSFPMFHPSCSLECCEDCLRTHCELHRDTRA